MPPEMESEPTLAPEPVSAKPVAGLYNLVKAWARLPEDQAREKVALAMQRPESINAKNNKGSTGLHAAGYLRRWDLAKIMLEAGADPLVKNLAGHDFYVLLVTAPRSPWRDLLATRPDLIAKQEEFLDARKKQSAAAKEKGSERKKEKVASVKAKKPERFKRKSESSLDAEGMQKLESLEIIGLDGEMIPHAQAWREARQSALDGSGEGCIAWIKSGQLHPGYDPEGLTLAQELVQLGTREMLSAALNAGLSSKTPNRRGETPLHTASLARRPDLAQLLLTAGADPAHRSAVGETALSIACLHDDADMAERLLAFGASPSERLESGETLVSAAERLGHFEIADILAAELEHQPVRPVASVFESDEPDEANDVNGNTLEGPKVAKVKGGKKGGPKPVSKRAGQPNGGGAKAKGAGARAGGKKRSGGSKRASPMIAKLDGPLKEVDDFARYNSAPKSSGPGPVIIVKKSRAGLLRPLDSEEGASPLGGAPAKSHKPGM